MSEKLYFWQKDIWNDLTNSSVRNLKGSVFLFTGLIGIGKMDFAKEYSKWLLCEKVNSEEQNNISKNACGACQACKWFDAGTHPDFMNVDIIYCKKWQPVSFFGIIGEWMKAILPRN